MGEIGLIAFTSSAQPERNFLDTLGGRDTAGPRLAAALPDAMDPPGRKTDPARSSILIRPTLVWS
jgi:hypothetical protein